MSEPEKQAEECNQRTFNSQPYTGPKNAYVSLPQPVQEEDLKTGNPHKGFDEVKRDIDVKDLGFLFDLVHVPCFRDTMLFSMTGGGVLSAFRFYRTRDLNRSADLAVKSFVFFSLASWSFCRYQYREKRRKIELAFYEAQRSALEKVLEEKDQAATKGQVAHPP